ncbi:MAG: aminotransferase class I/II-fold pyridoxal phosphate-dependent enzyme [Bacteroidales bacterium]|nr:aminotransferase class I/II-fold pyridoxal phosphate-dependent enzyme [Bacteroidales bacterium]
MGIKERKYINDAFDTNWIAPLGPNVDAFEHSLENYCGVKHVAALSSGTAAIHLALILLGVKSGDEVLVSSFTFSATVNPIFYVGAVPVLVDSEPETWNMDPYLLEKAILERIKEGEKGRRGDGASSKPKAIIVVHLYGMPAKLDKILEIANKYDIPVIEDAAEALGSRYNSKHLGTFGELGILSFNGNKIITTSGGGALISDTEDLILKARFLSTQARDKAPHYQHSQIGYNYRMSNVLAGIGIGQMEVLDERVKKRRENFFFYKKNLASISGISFVEEPGYCFFSNHWLTTILMDPQKTDVTREQLQIALEENNIESRPVWKPMHLQPVFSKYPSYINGTSESLFDKGLCLPSGSNMTGSDRQRVLDVILKCFNK